MLLEIVPLIGRRYLDYSLAAVVISEVVDLEEEAARFSAVEGVGLEMIVPCGECVVCAMPSTSWSCGSCRDCREAGPGAYRFCRVHACAAVRELL